MSGSVEVGVVTGVVTDAEGETVEGAVCILKRQSDNEVFETTTDSNGVYRFEGLTSGQYHGFVRYTDSRGNLYNAQNKHSVDVIGVPDPVDNFEDGDITVLRDGWSGWTGDTNTLSAQQNTVIEGEWSGLFDPQDQDLRVTATRDSSDTPSEVKMLVRTDNQNGSSGDRIGFRMTNSSELYIIQIALAGNGSPEVNFSTVSGSWSINTTYLLRMYNIDFGAETFDYEIIRQSDDTTISSGSEPFLESASSADRIVVQSDSSNVAEDMPLVFDEVNWL